MKKLVLGSGLLVITVAAGLFFACGPVVENQEPTSQELCNEACEKQDECRFDSGGGSADDTQGLCKQYCDDTSEEVSDAGCDAEYKKALECWNDEFSCSPSFGSGDFPCEDAIDRFQDCFDTGSGSGS